MKGVTRMKILVLFVVSIPIISIQAEKWNSDREDWKQETSNTVESTILFESFLDADGMSFTEFLEFTEESSITEPEYSNGSDADHQENIYRSSRYSYAWARRTMEWESEIQDIRGFTRLLMRLNLDRMQMMYLDVLTGYVEYNIEELREYHDVCNIRRDFFMAFVDDFYMPVDIYFIWEDRSWFESDLHDLVAYAIGEINEMLTNSQLTMAQEIVTHIQWYDPPEPHWPVDNDSIW